MDEHEFSEQLLELYGIMMKWADEFVHTREAQEDLVHETVMKALAARMQYDPSRSLKSWVSRMMRNCYIDQWRRASKWPTDYLEDINYREPAIPANQSICLELKEALRAVGSLSEERLKVFMLALYGTTEVEISQLLCLPLGTVKCRIRKSRIEIHQRLAPI